MGSTARLLCVGLYRMWVRNSSVGVYNDDMKVLTKCVQGALCRRIEVQVQLAQSKQFISQPQRDW